MEKRQDPLEGFDWVFRPETQGATPPLSIDDTDEIFRPDATLHDLEPITEKLALKEPHSFFLVDAIRNHANLSRTLVRTGLALGAIAAGVTTAFVTQSPRPSADALAPPPTATASASPHPSQSHETITPAPEQVPEIPKEKAPIVSPTDTPWTSPAKSYPISQFTPSTRPTYSYTPKPSRTPVPSETVDATTRPRPSQTQPNSSGSPSLSQSPTPSAAPPTASPETSAPSINPTTALPESSDKASIEPSIAPSVSATQPETLRASQSPSFGG